MDGSKLLFEVIPVFLLSSLQQLTQFFITLAKRNERYTEI